jgi:uncharacterized LabA/DUF88 family protein
MFNPKTQKIKQTANNFPEKIKELKEIFKNETAVYIDYANVRPWSNKLNWHIDLKRLKQFLDSFNTIQSIKIYNGTLTGDDQSETFNHELKRLGYELKTKPVKIMRKSIDISSIPANSPVILEGFIRKPLLQKLKIETVEYLNSCLKELNKQNVFYIEDKKCNFDVEIGRDLLLDCRNKRLKNFVLWSGDSDFADPIEQLLGDSKKVFLFATARRVAFELNGLRSKGLIIYDIQKIRDFICWNRECSLNYAKRTPCGAPKL